MCTMKDAFGKKHEGSYEKYFGIKNEAFIYIYFASNHVICDHFLTCKHTSSDNTWLYSPYIY